MITFQRTVRGTTYDVARDVQIILGDIRSPRAPKTQARVFFVGEDHRLLFDQDRRRALALALSRMAKPPYPLYTILERGLDLGVDLPNFEQENIGAQASFEDRNQDLVDNVMLDRVVESHTLPDFVIFFGENHEANQGAHDPTRGLQHMLTSALDARIRAVPSLARAITHLCWYSYRSIDSCIADEKVDVRVKQKVKLNDDCFLGFVEYDAAHINHNMLLAEKCLVKTKYFAELRTRGELGGHDWWELYTTDDAAGHRAVQNARRDVYGGGARLEIVSVNPSFLIRAVRAADSPRKKEWKEFGHSVAH